MNKQTLTLEQIADNHAEANAEHMSSKELAAILAPLGFTEVVIDRTGDNSTDSCQRFVTCAWRADRVDDAAFAKYIKKNGAVLFNMADANPLGFFNRPNFYNPHLLSWQKQIHAIMADGVLTFAIRPDGAAHDIPAGGAPRCGDFMYMVCDTLRIYDDIHFDECHDSCLADMTNSVAA